MTTAIRRKARSSEEVGNLSRNVKRVQSVTSLKAKAGQTPADNGARIEISILIDKKDKAKEKCRCGYRNRCHSVCRATLSERGPMRIVKGGL